MDWRVRLADRDPGKLGVVLGAALLAGGLGFGLFRHPGFALIGAGMVLGATAEFWLGTSYRLTEESASAKCGASLTSIAWADVKRVSITGEAVKLSPLPRPTRMEPFRGVTLRTTPENREAVLAFVARHAPPAGEA